MVGILSGAVTNTPGLGAAQQAYTDMTGSADESIALGYAVAYPLGVIGIILAMLFIRYVFHVGFDDEAKKLEAENDTHAIPVSLIVKNPAVFNKKVMELAALLEHREFVISRIWRKATNKVEIVAGNTVLQEDDKIFVITTEHDAETIKTFIGEEIQMDRKQWNILILMRTDAILSVVSEI